VLAGPDDEAEAQKTLRRSCSVYPNELVGKRIRKGRAIHGPVV